MTQWQRRSGRTSGIAGRILWLLPALLLGACAVPAPRTGPPPSVPMPAPPPVVLEEVQPPEPEVVPEPAAPQPPPTAPAALALAAQSDQARAAGDLRLADLRLERALRIAPRDPELWSRLARVRLEQGEFVQAERMAQRSLQLGSGDRALALANWRIIVDAREGMGDTEGARRAIDEVRRLESGIG
ncbi:tetratricopeptide repeat protein [Thioalkalivibrio nitratireducens]|nr:tetratricopeptide repeat protein [Thioalkalivibrio nitratireducens]